MQHKLTSKHFRINSFSPIHSKIWPQTDTTLNSVLEIRPHWLSQEPTKFLSSGSLCPEHADCHLLWHSPMAHSTSTTRQGPSLMPVLWWSWHSVSGLFLIKSSNTLSSLCPLILGVVTVSAVANLWVPHYSSFVPLTLPLVNIITLHSVVFICGLMEFLDIGQCKLLFAVGAIVVQSLNYVQLQLFCNPLDCSPPGSFIHGIFQARILEWVAISFFKGSSPPTDWTPASCIGRQILYHWATRET